MVTWVLYDITDNRVRTHIASICLDYGLIRFQKSVFCGETDTVTLDRIRSRITEMVGTIEEGTAAVSIFTICDTCMKNHSYIGNSTEPAMVRQKNLIIIG